MINLEHHIIGQIIISSDCFDQYFDTLKPAYFDDQLCHELTLIGHNLKKKGQRLNILAAITALKASGKLQELGGVKKVTELTASVGSTANIEHDIACLVQEYVRKRMFALTSEAHVKAADNIQDPIQTVGWLTKQLQELTALKIGTGGSENVNKLFDQANDVIRKRNKAYKAGELLGIPTGFAKLNQETGGWQQKELIVMGARPKIGKTALLLHHAIGAARAGIPTAVFTLEISALSVTNRLITNASASKIDPRKFRTGSLSDEDFKTLDVAGSILKDYPIFVSDTCRTVKSIRNEVKRLKDEHDIKFVLIDFIQKIQSDSRHQNREREVSAIVDDLTFMAIDLDVALLAISRVNRAVESRPDKRAFISDLQDAGTIESNADMIILPYRNGAYDPDDHSNSIEYTVKAYRHGETFTFDIYHDKYMARFSEESNRFSDESNMFSSSELPKLKQTVNFRDFYNAERLGDDEQF